MLQPKLLPGHRGRVLQVFRLGEPNPVRRLRCTTAEAPLLLLSPQLSGEGTVRSISHHNGGHPRPGHVVLEPLQTPVVAGIHPLDRLCFVALNNAASGLEQLHKGLGAGGLKGRRVFDHHRPSPAGLHRRRHHRLEILLAGRNQRPEPFTAFQPAQGVQRVSTLIGKQKGDFPLVSEGGKGPQIRRRGSHQQLELRRGHQLRIGEHRRSWSHARQPAERALHRPPPTPGPDESPGGSCAAIQHRGAPSAAAPPALGG